MRNERVHAEDLTAAGPVLRPGGNTRVAPPAPVPAASVPARAPGPTGRRAFTLVEMLVVIFIIAVLVALVVGVTRSVLSQESAKRTRQNMEIILSAVETYRDVMKTDYPPDSTDTAGLYTELATVDKALDRLRALPKDCFKSGKFLDGWGNPMRYTQVGGKGGAPRLESGGPDGDFAKKGDNIRSDD